MNTQDSKLYRKDVSAEVADGAIRLLPAIARRKAARQFPVLAGQSYLYEVAPGWQADALALDHRIVRVESAQALEAAFAHPGIKNVFIPLHAAMTRQAAMTICCRHGHGKTIFYEVNDE